MRGGASVLAAMPEAAAVGSAGAAASGERQGAAGRAAGSAGMSQRDPVQARANAQARLRRGMFLLPSLFTAGNIGAGYFSIIQTIAAISGDAVTHLDWAAIAILFAIPFDALDGRIARMTNTCSDFGKELDSLADVITFGVAPSFAGVCVGLSLSAGHDQPGGCIST